MVICISKIIVSGCRVVVVSAKFYITRFTETQGKLTLKMASTVKAESIILAASVVSTLH